MILSLLYSFCSSSSYFSAQSCLENRVQEQRTERKTGLPPTDSAGVIGSISSVDLDSETPSQVELRTSYTVPAAIIDFPRKRTTTTGVRSQVAPRASSSRSLSRGSSGSKGAMDSSLEVVEEEVESSTDDDGNEQEVLAIRMKEVTHKEGDPDDKDQEDFSDEGMEMHSQEEQNAMIQSEESPFISCHEPVSSDFLTRRVDTRILREKFFLGTVLGDVAQDSTSE